MTTAQKVIKYCAIAFALFLIVSIAGGIIGAMSTASLFFDDKDPAGEMKTYAVTDTVENLEIDLSGARLEIKTGGDFSVESDHADLKVENKDGMLRIKDERSALRFHSEGVRIILTVPEDFSFGRAGISTGAGSVKIDTLLSEKLTMDLGAGEVNIGKLVACTKAKISGGAGEVNIDGGELNDLDLDLGVGEVDLESRLTGKCEIDHGVGELNLTLTGTPDEYCVTVEKGVGEATLDGMKMADGAVYGDGDNSIGIDGGVGEIKIRFSN